ncbi:MAG: FtsH protease activity modulator HflK [Desulfobacteraceae bacterium]|nr:FtsH protease activity modulator HflK [Desulfobacteraceae bacterium]
MNWDWDKLREKQEKYEQSQSGGGIPKPPQVDDVLNKFKHFRFPGGILLIVVLFFLFFGSSMFFTVGVDEVGVIQRFGKYDRIGQPGLNFKMPSGIERVTKVKIKRIYKEEFGFRTKSFSNSRFSNDNEDMGAALMLTGDLNVAVVPWIVQYRISDPYMYLFKVKDVNSILRDMAEATMRTVVGDRSINEVISKREEIAIAAKERLQEELKQAETGIHIVTIEMKKTNVPEPVQPSFNEVNEAVQEKEQLIYKAREELNKAIPAARGEARRVVKDAEGYALDRVNRAEGDVARFNSVYKEYVKAKDVTEKRLYLEAMAEVLPKLGQKYVVDSEQSNLLPLLNMGGGGTLNDGLKGNGGRK